MPKREIDLAENLIDKMSAVRSRRKVPRGLSREIPRLHQPKDEGAGDYVPPRPPERPGSATAGGAGASEKAARKRRKLKLDTCECLE